MSPPPARAPPIPPSATAVLLGRWDADSLSSPPAQSPVRVPGEVAAGRWAEGTVTIWAEGWAFTVSFQIAEF